MLTYEAISEAIEREGKRLGKLAEECADIAQMAAEAEADYKTESAQARMRIRDDAAGVGAKITNGEVEDRATLECSVSLRTHLVASSSLTAIRSALGASQSRLSALQSLHSGYRSAGG